MFDIRRCVCESVALFRLLTYAEYVLIFALLTGIARNKNDIEIRPNYQIHSNIVLKHMNGIISAFGCYFCLFLRDRLRDDYLLALFALARSAPSHAAVILVRKS